MYDSSYVRDLECQIYRDQKQNGVCQELGERGGESVLKGYGI